VSSLAQTAALAAIDDQQHIKRVVLNNAGQAQLLGVALSELGYRVVPTSANFLYCDVGEDAAAIAEQLRSDRVSVRPLGGWGSPTCLRVSIGRPEQNDIFLRALRRIASAKHIAQ
jgi:histidinol-phosphate aminotransferase